MDIADDAEIGMAEDGSAFILVNRYHIASLANARDMFGRAANAQSEIEPWGNRASGQADLHVFGQPTLVSDIARGTDSRVEQFGEVVNLRVVFWIAHTHAYSKHDLCALHLPHARFLALLPKDLCANARGDTCDWQAPAHQSAAL